MRARVRHALRDCKDWYFATFCRRFPNEAPMVNSHCDSVFAPKENHCPTSQHTRKSGSRIKCTCTRTATLQTKYTMRKSNKRHSINEKPEPHAIASTGIAQESDPVQK